MSYNVKYQTERLGHLGIGSGVGQQAGIAEWRVKQTGENRRSLVVLSFIMAHCLLVYRLAEQLLHRHLLATQQTNQSSYNALDFPVF